MELDSLFTSTKWEILRVIAEKPKSPLELSRVLDTSMANISQQLSLLEFAGLVEKERLSNRAAGKPRKRYSLKKYIVYLVVLSGRKQVKKLVPLTERIRGKIDEILESG